ncbi:MAG: FtsQ-type POTRA domain-containing protein [Deltaproteobacteria bacterium]|jgi:cell division protein FtsQ|nr:FtsQ-type POTRA domain-containing protein [Deltaproteobacteria bacterium]
MGMKEFSTSAKEKEMLFGQSGRGGGKGKTNRYQEEKKPGGPKLYKLPKLKFGAFFRWAGGLVLGLAFFFGFGLGLVHTYNFFITNAYFGLKSIEISGNNRLKSREVIDILELDYGKNVLAVSIEAMEAALARNPWVEGLSVKRILPDRFEVAVRERQPRYWVNRNGILYYADAFGAPIMPVTAGGFSSFPALEIEAGAEHLAPRLPELVRSLAEAELPLDIASSAWLRLSAAGALELRPSSRLRVVIGLEGWERNLQHLDRVLEDLSRRGELRQAAEIRADGNNVWVAGKAAI